MLESKYLKNHARYEKAIIGFLSYLKSSFKMKKNVFCCHHPSRVIEYSMCLSVVVFGVS